MQVDARGMGSVPGSGRSSGGGHGNPLQFSCLENPMDRGVGRDIAGRDKKAFFNEQCMEVEENNRMGKTRDLFEKMEDNQGNISCKDGHDNGQKR